MLRYGSLCLLIACVAPVVSAEEFVPDFLPKVAPSIVRIEAIRAEHRGVQIGTGIVLALEQVATVCHVIHQSAKTHVIYTGRRFAVTAIKASPERDLCILHVAGLDAVPAPVRLRQRPRVAEPVVAVGFSGGGRLRWRTGEIYRTHLFDGAYVVQSSSAFTSGASGGPLMDANGRVIGLLSYRMRITGPQFFSIPVEWADDLLVIDGDDRDVNFAMAPFWARDEGELPYFMRAGELEKEQRWGDLLALCVAWRTVEPHNGEPAYYESRAETVGGHLEAAQDKLERAVELDSGHELAWYELVRVRLALGDIGGAREAWSRLAQLNERLAGRLLRENGVLM